MADDDENYRPGSDTDDGDDDNYNDDGTATKHKHSGTTSTDEKTRHRKQKRSLPTQGARLEVWWPDDERYYTGQVVTVRKRKRDDDTTTINSSSPTTSSGGEGKQQWKIRYDDGETEWLDLRHEQYRLLAKSDETNKVHGNDACHHVPPNDTSQVGVGTAVCVWWEYYSQYFPGIVRRIRTNRTRPFFVQYEDGDARWEDLSATRFYIQTSSSSSSGAVDNDGNDASSASAVPWY